MQLVESKILAIAGKSGSGKTTLLKCIYGLTDLSAGQVEMDGRLVTGPSYQLIPGDEDMSLVSQDFYVLDNHTVAENISDKLIGYTDAYKSRRTAALLSLLELGALRDRRARDLSSGQKQRVAIARALAVMPRLLLLDEPFSNLDHLLTQKLFDFILKEVRKGKTSALLITHRAEEALKYADEVAIMDNGRILQSGNTWEVYYHPVNTRLAGLLGEFNNIHPDDLEKTARKKYDKKFLLRPDQLSTCPAHLADLILELKQCVYNGKCYELLLQTKQQRSVLVYSPRALKPGKQIAFMISKT